MKRVLCLLLCWVMLLSCCPGLAESATATYVLRERYAQAELQLANKNYAEAAAQFEALGAYADASQMAMYCKALMAAEDLGLYDMAVQAFQGLGDFRDSKQMTTYYLARGYEAAGDAVDVAAALDSQLEKARDAYQEAINRYSALALFKDSLTRYADCTAKESAVATELNSRALARMEEKYQQALALENEGKYEEAIKVFETIKQYKDCAEHITACQDGIK